MMLGVLTGTTEAWTESALRIGRDEDIAFPKHLGVEVLEAASEACERIQQGCPLLPLLRLADGDYAERCSSGYR
jgi:hypothetical protein